jgi:DNA-directed RNA polymerase specialized sigma24 family protein
LKPRLRTQFDSTDFQQDVWASFFKMPPEQATFETPDELARYLTAMAGYKVADENRRRLHCRKHDLYRERPLPDLLVAQDEGIISPQPSPSQTAAAQERWEHLMRDPSPVARQVLTLLRDGYSHDQIANLTGLHVKAIQRYVRKVKERLQS